jgi:DNA-binding IclR family transcriptional regulator
MEEPKYPIKSTQNSLAIVDAIQEMEKPTVTDLATELDRSKSVIHNHLQTLMAAGLVTKHDDTYDVGLGFLHYGCHARRSLDVYTEAKDHVDDIAVKTGEQVNLVIEQYGKGYVIHQKNGGSAVNTAIQTGSILPLYCTAAGKAILSFLPEDRVDEYFERTNLDQHTWATITDEDELRTEFDEVTESLPWVAYDRSERANGVRSVATPLLDSNRTVHGALSVAMPNNRFYDEKYRDSIADHIEGARDTISPNLSFD